MSTVLNSPELYEEWKSELQGMAHRILEMRAVLYAKLIELKTPVSALLALIWLKGDWKHITNQIGMFSYTGLSKLQSETLTEKFQVYLTTNGRISMAGLNHGNMARFVECFDWVVRNVKEVETKI